MPAIQIWATGLPAPNPKKVSWPLKARYPAKGMMTSLGSGMQALSMAMSSMTPRGPAAAMTATIQATMGARSFWSMAIPKRTSLPGE